MFGLIRFQSPLIHLAIIKAPTAINTAPAIPIMISIPPSMSLGSIIEVVIFAKKEKRERESYHQENLTVTGALFMIRFGCDHKKNTTIAGSVLFVRAFLDQLW